MSLAREQRRDDLWDLLVAAPLGVTIEDMMGVYGWSHHHCNVAISDLRRHLGDHDTVNLTCEPQGMGERWLYRLVGKLDETDVWMGTRIRDSETRLRTMQSMMTSIVTATNGRTTEGRKARTMERALRHLVEDLDAMAQ